MSEYVHRRLKSIEQLKLEFNCELDRSGDIVLFIDDRGINDEMIGKFGDGVLYEFEELVSATAKHDFTHTGPDNWYYHESWFEEEKREELDFGIEELFEL